MTDCPRPACTGAIEHDYCNRCGSPAVPHVMPDPTDPASSPTLPGSTGISTGISARRAGLGAGLVDLPPVPSENPIAAVLDDPAVPERRRFCDNPECRHPVGRSKNGRPGRVEGFCPKCRQEFSFRPPLRCDRIGQYEVRGALAPGGLGWIYLAWDHEVSRWVVLKGLMDPDDPDARQAAVAELRSLAEARHPNIVTIHNVVHYPHPRTGANVDYIVMEYVGGKSLKQLLQQRLNDGGVLALEEVCAYVLEVLPALEYLHSRGLAYNDFSPDNVMYSDEDGVLLIDLGGVCRIGDRDSGIWGKDGFRDPGITEHGPSVATDLYAVARTMAVLSFAFPGFSDDRQGTLPGPDEVELLARHESYDRLLQRATNPDPAQRFASAAEMAQQLEGVLREVLTLQDRRPRPAESLLFGPELRVVGADADGFPTAAVDGVAAALALPEPQVDASDPQAGLLATLSATSPDERLRALSRIPRPSLETRLRAARARIELGELDTVTIDLDKLAGAEPGNWRVTWYRGLAALVGGHLDDAWDAFDAVLDAVPGEAAPKLALAGCAQRLGEHQVAEHYYDTVWRTDHSYVSAAFGLARARFALGDRVGSAAALELVPENNRQRATALLCAILARARDRAKGEPLVHDFFDAAERLQTLDLDAAQRWRAVAEVFEVALGWQLDGRPWPPGRTRELPDTLLRHELTQRGLRDGLEEAYRALARLADDAEERIALVDRADAARNWSWV
ncbi:MAG: tetratricopeptide repeat protein [Pseudonocardiaceae bacterium]